MRPAVSVCIANYNGIGLVDACIESVREQKTTFPFEIIVHDDASSDDSAAHIQACHPDVTLIQSDENVGFCVANNRMVEKARGEYLLLLNNDAALMQDALSVLFTESQRLGQPAILGLPQYGFDEAELIDRGCLLDPFFNPVPNLDPERQDVAMTIGACLWIPRSLWEELGGFPEWFGSIGEDLLLCCMARLTGHPVRICSSSGYRHHVGKSFGGGKVASDRLSTTFRRRALSERNKTFVMATTCPAPFMQLLLPLHLTLMLIEGALLSLLRLNPAYLAKIYLPVFAGLRTQYAELRKERHRAMMSRRLTGADFFAVFDPLPYKLRMLLRHGMPRLDE